MNGGIRLPLLWKIMIIFTLSTGREWMGKAKNILLMGFLFEQKKGKEDEQYSVILDD